VRVLSLVPVERVFVAFEVGGVALAVGHSLQEFSREYDGPIFIDNLSPAVLQVALVVPFIPDVSFELVHSVALLLASCELTLVIAQSVNQFA